MTGVAGSSMLVIYKCVPMAARHGQFHYLMATPAYKL